MNCAMRGAAVIAIMASGLAVNLPADAQNLAQNMPPPQPAAPGEQPVPANQYSSNELIDAGHRFFGGVSRGLAMIVEKAVSQWGQPNGYVLGEEASGAFVGGLRFGGINGSAYFIGGFGMTALTANNIVLVPIRSGVGFRLGANLGYLKFTDHPTWNPF